MELQTLISCQYPIKNTGKEGIEQTKKLTLKRERWILLDEVNVQAMYFSKCMNPLQLRLAFYRLT